MSRYIMMELKQYADKELKFKQGRLLQKARADQRLSDGVYAWAKGGVCLAATVNWLIKRKTFRESTPEDLIDKALSGQFLYDRYFPATVDYLTHSGLEEIDVNLAHVKSPPDLAGKITLWQRLDRRPSRAALVEFSVGSLGGHAVGVIEDSGMPLEFFDPNFGWYRITKGKEGTFFTRYSELYKTHLGVITAIKVKAVGKAK